jgi:hypothetical protein
MLITALEHYSCRNEGFVSAGISPVHVTTTALGVLGRIYLLNTEHDDPGLPWLGIKSPRRDLQD